jgi:hypothetical protein
MHTYHTLRLGHRYFYRDSSNNIIILGKLIFKDSTMKKQGYYGNHKYKYVIKFENATEINNEFHHIFDDVSEPNDIGLDLFS